MTPFEALAAARIAVAMDAVVAAHRACMEAGCDGHLVVDSLNAAFRKLRDASNAVEGKA